MCGIVGILSKTGENVVPLAESMLSCIACRGPDGGSNHLGGADSPN